MKNALTTYALQVHLQVDRREVLDECLTELREMPRLQVLSITVGSFILDERQMAVLGAMPLADLRLLSQVLLSLLSLPLPHIPSCQFPVFVFPVRIGFVASYQSHDVKVP
jgi:hypothetical protein